MVNGSFGYAVCRFAGGPPDEEMGSKDLTDGRWVWPEGLAVYVERFGVRLPDEFLEHARANDFRIPPERLVGLTTHTPYSEVFWREWARKHRSNRLLAFASKVFCRQKS